jgi:hypothetical protein
MLPFIVYGSRLCFEKSAEGFRQDELFLKSKFETFSDICYKERCGSAEKFEKNELDRVHLHMHLMNNEVYLWRIFSVHFWTPTDFPICKRLKQSYSPILTRFLVLEQREYKRRSSL